MSRSFDRGRRTGREEQQEESNESSAEISSSNGSRRKSRRVGTRLLRLRLRLLLLRFRKGDDEEEEMAFVFWDIEQGWVVVGQVPRVALWRAAPGSVDGAYCALVGNWNPPCWLFVVWGGGRKQGASTFSLIRPAASTTFKLIHRAKISKPDQRRLISGATPHH